MKKETYLSHFTQEFDYNFGVANPPLYQGSTITFSKFADYKKAEKGDVVYDLADDVKITDQSYGTGGTPTNFALQKALCELENGVACVLTPSGLSAITLAISALVQAGDHVLIPDNVYSPTRRFCNLELKKFGVEVDYFPADADANIADFIKVNTKIIFLENPGSLTFEVQDIEAIVAIAKEKNIITIFDNSWATPLYFSPLEHGIDISIQAVTKYIAGHSDILMGAVIANEKYHKNILKTAKNYGFTVSPQDSLFVLRGLRTLVARLKFQQESTSKIIDFLAEQPKVSNILYPAYKDSPDLERFKKYFTGATSLFSIILDKKYDEKQIAEFVDNLQYFAIGASWGGFLSLVLPFDPTTIRTCTKWEEERSAIRFYIGLENSEDLVADLKQGLQRL